QESVSLSVQVNLILKNHQIKRPEKIVRLARLLSLPALAAPTISLGSDNTNNQFLTTLASSLVKKDPDSYLGSLVHLDLTGSALIANKSALQDILLLLNNNPMLVIIDFDRGFKKYLSSIDSELLINSQLEINQKNLVSLIKKLILARDINQ